MVDFLFYHSCLDCQSIVDHKIWCSALSLNIFHMSPQTKKIWKQPKGWLFHFFTLRENIKDFGPFTQLLWFKSNFHGDAKEKNAKEVLYWK